MDAKDAGKGEREKSNVFLFTFPMIPSAEPKSQSLSNPLEHAWVRGRSRGWMRLLTQFFSWVKSMPFLRFNQANKANGCFVMQALY